MKIDIYNSGVFEEDVKRKKPYAFSGYGNLRAQDVEISHPDHVKAIKEFLGIDNKDTDAFLSLRWNLPRRKYGEDFIPIVQLDGYTYSSAEEFNPESFVVAYSTKNEEQQAKARELIEMINVWDDVFVYYYQAQALQIFRKIPEFIKSSAVTKTYKISDKNKPVLSVERFAYEKGTRTGLNITLQNVNGNTIESADVFACDVEDHNAIYEAILVLVDSVL